MPSNPTVALGDTLGLWRDKINLTIAEVNSHVGSSGGAHADVTTTVAGFMSAADKTKLNGVANNANNYTHPATDGNKHVPANGTTNDGKVLKATSTAGTYTWGTLNKTDVGLANVDNTSDVNKPVSTATQNALNLKISKNSDTGVAYLPVGTTAQRPSGSNGMIRYNTTLNTFEGFVDGAWGPVGGGAKGTNNNQVFYENDIYVTAGYSITSGKNAMTAGPITINDGVEVTVPDGSVWTIV